MLSITKFVLHSIELPFFVLSVVVVEVVRVVVLWGNRFIVMVIKLCRSKRPLIL